MKADKRTNNGLQKGQRRQKLHNNQNNVGNDKIQSSYTNFEGEPIE